MGSPKRPRVGMFAAYPWCEEEMNRGGVVQSNYRLVNALAERDDIDLHVFSASPRATRTEIRRVGLARVIFYPPPTRDAAFLFRPSLVIMDEPTAGLDPSASSTLKDKILRERERGVTFILTSHVMAELEELSDAVVFLLNGRVRFQGPADAAKLATGQVNLERAVAELMREVA